MCNRSRFQNQSSDLHLVFGVNRKSVEATDENVTGQIMRVVVAAQGHGPR